MRFTGTNLQFVRYGLSVALDEVNNEIVKCTDPWEPENQELLLKYGKERVAISRLLANINAAIQKEANRKQPE